MDRYSTIRLNDLRHFENGWTATVTVQPVLDFVDGNGISYYIDMESVQGGTTSEEGYGDWPGADSLLSSNMCVFDYFTVLYLFLYVTVYAWPALRLLSKLNRKNFVP